MQTTFTKSITAQFEQVGRKQKLVGQLGEIRDESGVLIHSQLYNTPLEAEIKLNALVRELLTDYADRGLVDTVPVEVTGTCQCRTCIQPATHNVDGTLACCFHYSEELTGVLCDCTDDDYADAAWESDHGSYNGKVPSDFTQIDPATAYTAQSLANRLQSPAYVVAQAGHYLIQDDADLDCYGGRADIVATYQPRADDDVPTDNPDIGSGPATEGPSPLRQPVLDAMLAAQAAGLCVNCGGKHRTWQCGEIAQRLFAQPSDDWRDADLGRELCRLRWRDFPRFRSLLCTVGAAGHLRAYAASYVAYLETYGPASLSIPQVLTVWGRIMAEQQVAA